MEEKDAQQIIYNALNLGMKSGCYDLADADKIIQALKITQEKE
jgi:hypothetical protein